MLNHKASSNSNKEGSNNSIPIHGFNILYFESLDSTNNYVKNNLDSLPDKTAVVARIQTAGRGQFNRQWFSDEMSLTFSYLVKNIKNPVSLIALNAIAVLRAIERLFAVKLSIKWPNDILMNKKKVCGILCESRLHGDSFCVISGIGINLSTSGEFFLQKKLEDAVAIPNISNVQKQALLMEILKQAENIIYSDFKEYRQEYIDNCINIEKIDF